MPCAASPPSTFCQEKVTTSSFGKSRACAKAAEVASQMVSPSRSAAIQSASGTRTPEVVPFQANTTSRVLVSTLAEVGQLAVRRLDDARVLQLELLDDVRHPALAEALPGQHVDRRARRASTTAPSRPRRCRRPARCRCGSRREPRSTSRVRSIARFRRALPSLARCERPSASVLRFSGTSRGAWRRGRTKKTARAGARGAFRS